jgi:glycosyltransferase involved in cell wall biosynthesis
MTPRKTILFVNGSSSIEGDTRVFIDTLASLDQARFRPVCLTTPGPAHDEIARIPGVELHVAPLGRTAGQSGRLRLLTSTLTGFATLLELMRRTRPDLVYSYDRTRATEMVSLAATLLRRRLALHAHLPIQYNGGRVRRRVMFGASRIIACSRYVADCYIRAGCPAWKLSVVLNAVRATPMTEPAGTELRASLGIAADAPVISIVGRISPFKGHEELFHAVSSLRARYPALRLLIAGGDTDESIWTHGPHETSFRAVLERLSAQLGLEDCVIFLGRRSPPTDVYLAADVVAAPSHAEPFGLVVIEAMHAGRAVVSCDAGGVPEIIRDGETGLLVPPKSPEALASAIARLLDDAALRQRIAAAGQREAAGRFTAERYAADVGGVLESI